MSITVAENMANARRIRDEKRELRARYVAALERVVSAIRKVKLAHKEGGDEIFLAIACVEGIRAELGGKR